MLKTLALFIFLATAAFAQNEVIMGSQQYSFTFPEGWEVNYDADHPSGILALSQNKEIDMAIYELRATMEEVLAATGTEISDNYESVEDYMASDDVRNGIPVKIINAAVVLPNSDVITGLTVMLFQVSDEMIIKIYCELKADVSGMTYSEMELIIDSLKKL